MKKLSTIIVMAFLGLTSSMAQTTTMQFEGPSRFGVAAMNAWQDNERDVIVMSLTDTSKADITIPDLTYNVMQLTIPSFTVSVTDLSYDEATGNITFPDHTYTLTVTSNGVEKTLTIHSFTGSYDNNKKTLSLNAVISYGAMPVQVTYIINDAAYITPEGINHTTLTDNAKTVKMLDGKNIIIRKGAKSYNLQGVENR